MSNVIKFIASLYNIIIISYYMLTVVTLNLKNATQGTHRARPTI